MERYVFGNGVQVKRRDLLDIQIERYAGEGNPNLHEPVEEACILQAFATDTPSEPVFLDVGAGIGYYSVLIKKTWPAARIYAVEALPRHAEAILETLEMNGLPREAATIIHDAIGDREGWAEFIDEGYSSMLTSAEGQANALRVKVRTLTGVLADIPPVHLMKMDIQGGELAVLTEAREALRAGRVTNVMIGTHGLELHEAVRDLLVACDFRLLHDDQAPPMQPDGILLGTRA